jgi:low temperature requirement protein LtrA
VRRSRTVHQFESDQGTDSALAQTILRKQHEASSLELFFDLFFVGNLAVFTDIHAHVDAQCELPLTPSRSLQELTSTAVANYIGIFSILWTTWFHISIYDVRFYTDCMLSRLFKIVCFGVMTSFVGLGPVYDTIMSGGSTRAFTGLALVLMALRFMLTIQYGVVLYFVRGFHKTLIPLVLTMTIYSISGLAFLITYLVDRSAQLTGSQGATHVARWYIILGVEVIGVIVVSSTWRILSFRHTHLVERVGLLTLIVMGKRFWD